MSNRSIFCETGFEITYFYSFQFFCLFVSKTNFLTGIFHNTPKYFDFLLRFWHVQFEGFARLADVQSVGKKSHLDFLYHALMTWVWVIGGTRSTQGKICLSASLSYHKPPTYLSEVRNQRLNIGLMVVGYQLGYWWVQCKFYILRFYGVYTSGLMVCAKKKLCTNTFQSQLETQFQISTNKF